MSGASEVVIWGTGTPKREFLHVDDLAKAVVFLLQLKNPPDWINVGTGTDLSIKELAELVSRIVGYAGRIVFDPAQPDGTPRKLMDVSRLAALGWQATTGIQDGVHRTYESFLEELQSNRLREA